MQIKNIIIVLGEPYSTFSEIIAKYFKNKKRFKKKIIIIGNIKLLKNQLSKLKYKIKLNHINRLRDAKINILNMIDVNFGYDKIFDTISTKSNKFIENSFEKSLKLLKYNKKSVLINGPISKANFLKKKYPGITEYLSKKTKSKKEVMLIYNKKLSVSPITTHMPLKYVSKNLSIKKIRENIILINNFYKKVLKRDCKFAVLGLNPHCETTDKFSEEDKIIKPAIKQLKNHKINVNGPFSSDTFFLTKNINKYDVVIGMYHDQVLTPIKTIFNFDAINITIGLPFIRISPDHGPNSEMQGKNKSDPSSFIYAMNFIDCIK